jgi:hypothetical protein
MLIISDVSTRRNCESEKIWNSMGYQFLSAAEVKVVVLWDVAQFGGILPTFQRCLPPS